VAQASCRASHKGSIKAAAAELSVAGLVFAGNMANLLRLQAALIEKLAKHLARVESDLIGRSLRHNRERED
jgi:hypothetical protein